MAFEAGQTIGDYEIVAKLGAGGLGAVYEVRHKISQRREAMKILLPDQSGTAEMVERFRREVQTLATLNHPNIAALHNAFYYDNQLVMVMELIHGQTLRDRRLRTTVTLPQALDIAAQILRALVYAHALGVVHRDIKPSNIMITEAGEVKLLDFGIAIAGGPGELTRAGYLLGSLSYMSPEQVSGARATSRSDLYSLGVTLYEFLTGQLPITGKSDYEVMMGHMHQVAVPPHQLVSAIPVPLSVAIMRALAKDPADRFPSAEEFLQAVETVAGVAHEQHPVPTGSSLPPPVRPSRSSEWLQPKPASGSGLQSLPLEEIARKLGVYIGPVAKIIVKRLAEKSQDPDTIYREAAKQIASDADRAAFLRSRHE
ncbi:MAG: serine/threonine-protein kinase [Acidobacteriaceae bacterium]